MSKSESPRKVLVVGAGPVGSLAALLLHQRGWQVEVWDGRDDPRRSDRSPAALRSINLAISSRGLGALRAIHPPLADHLLSLSVPMKGRMIHHLDGHQESQLYDPKEGQCIHSVPRPALNLALVDALPSDVDVHFQRRLSRIDWKTRVAYADHAECSFDLVIGCDGSWSKVRQEMMKSARVDFRQSFIPHAYIELHMPPGEHGFKMDANHLHIWPRHSFMLIGLPNQDGSFTLTLFAPFSEVDRLKTRHDAEQFFQTHFPTALEWAGRERLLDDFERNPRASLVTINVSPSATDCALLLGDSSHSMVPFYGQGLNCGLEDVRVFKAMLESHEELTTALQEYSRIRGKDLEAICELAMENYEEMRSKVITPMHHLRRGLDAVLSTLLRPTPMHSLDPTAAFPTSHVSGWSSLYSMVTFRPDVSYAEALRKEKAQRKTLEWVAGGLVSAVGVGAACGAAWAWRRYR